jgi:hypothetical protein
MINAKLSYFELGRSAHIERVAVYVGPWKLGELVNDKANGEGGVTFHGVGARLRQEVAKRYPSLDDFELDLLNAPT